MNYRVSGRNILVYKQIMTNQVLWYQIDRKPLDHMLCAHFQRVTPNNRYQSFQSFSRKYQLPNITRRRHKNVHVAYTCVIPVLFPNTDSTSRCDNRTTHCFKCHKISLAFLLTRVTELLHVDCLRLKATCFICVYNLLAVKLVLLRCFR